MNIRKIKRFSQAIYKAVSELLKQLVPEEETLSEEKFTGILKTRNTDIFIVTIEKKMIIGMLTLITGDKIVTSSSEYFMPMSPFFRDLGTFRQNFRYS